MINFRYMIVQKLGEGGSGEVFLVEDTLRNNQRVALKVLHAHEKVGSATDEAFRNEVSALLNLQHPNLVRIFDFGVVRHCDVQPLEHRRFFTMEYISGSDALRWARAVTTQRDKEMLVETIMLQALSVLSYIHRAGVIHFDIKPQNFILIGERDSSPQLKLTDFGFSRQQDDTAEVSTRGTLEYTAPELLRGSTFDSSVDLYSLGATLFELIEGHCPFEATTSVEVIKKVLADEVVFTPAQSERTTRLQEIVARLLQKNPSERFREASEAARELLNGAPNGRELYDSYFGISKKPKFVGRGEERSTIAAAISCLAQGKPIATPAIVLTGVEGIGKTALLLEGARNARSLEIPLYVTTTARSNAPYESVRLLLKALLCDIRSHSEEGRNLFARYKEILGFDKEIEPSAWVSEKERYGELIARLLSDCSRISPYVIVADNLQLLDRESLNILRAVVRDIRSSSIVLLAAETTEQATAFREVTIHEMRLRELPEEDVAAMCMCVLGKNDVAVAVASNVYQLYGGTPSTIVEALGAVYDDIPQEVYSNVETAKEYLAQLESKLPRNTEEFFLNRFRRLNGERQLILSFLSCFQHPAHLEILLRLLPLNKGRCVDQLRFLHLEGFVSFSEVNYLASLRLKRLKAAIYNSLEGSCGELHTLIANAIESSTIEQGFIQLQELAHQLSCAGNTAKAATAFELAADEGLRLFAFERTLQLYADAISCAHELNADTTTLKVKNLDALFRAGEFRRSIEEGSQLVVSEGLSSQSKASVIKSLGLSYSRLGDIEQAQHWLTIALQTSDNEVERVELRQELVALEIAAGNCQEAERVCKEQLEYARRLQNNRITGTIYTDLGIAAFFQNRFDEASKYFSDALENYEVLNEKTQITNAINNVGNALSAQGKFSQAISYWDRALKSSQEFGTYLQQAQIQNNLGIAYFNLKQYQKAKTYYVEARSIYERMNSRNGIGQALVNLGEVTFAEGEYESALNRWTEAKNVFAATENVYAQTEAGLHLATVFWRLGDFQNMAAELDVARVLIHERQQHSFTARYKYLCGVSFLAMKEFQKAEACLRESKELYQAERSNDKAWLATLKLAEVKHLNGESNKAVEIAHEVLTSADTMKNHQILAEANYLLGVIAIAKPAALTEKPILYFKNGLDAVAKEPIGETTWKLTYALAREYYERGQLQRSREFLMKTKLVVQFFLSHFQSNELKEHYLAAEQKQNVLATIDALTRQEGSL